MKDSVKHYSISVIGSFLITFLLFFLFEDKEIAIYLGGAIMFLIGILKEVVWDWLMKRGVPSLADITLDAMGVFTAMFIMMMFI